MVIATSLGLYNLNYFSYIEGAGKVDVSYKTRIKSTVLLIILLFAFTNFKFGLFSYPIALLICNLYSYFLLKFASGELDRNYSLTNNQVSSKLQIGKDQRRMSCSN